MDSIELQRWREADGLFACWLNLPWSERSAWLAGRDIDAQVADLLQRMIDRHQRDAHAATASPAFDRLRAVDVQPASHLAGRRVGDWQLIEELGRGGMSLVYRARRVVSGVEQEAAVKLLGMAFLGTQGRRRFEQERRVLARLRHPQIAALIDGGVADDGTPFLAMTLVEGETLAEHCRRHVPDWRGRVALVRRVCDAVAHAHRNLLVHRDIKPSNVVVTDEGLPVLLDFGIARLLDNDEEHTRTGLRALTPGYAAPEQVEDGAISTATDVYALGVVLRSLCQDTGPLPVDLRNIMARASHPDPERRYADARALGEDLDNLLQQRPVRATPDSWSYRLRIFLRRRRGAVAAASTVAVSLILGLGLALWQAQRAAAEADEARHQMARAEAARDFLFSLFRSGDREASDRPDLPVSTVIERGAASLRDQPPEDPELHAEVAMMLGQFDTALGRHESATALLEVAGRAAERSGNVALRISVLSRLGTLANAVGNPVDALAQFDAALAMLPAAPAGRRASLLAGIATGWAYAMENSGREAEAHARLQDALNAPYLQVASQERARVLSALAMTTRDPARKLAILLETWEIFADLPAPPTDRLALAANLGTTYSRLGRHVESLTWAREAARLADRVYPGATSRRARVYGNLASSANRVARWREAGSALATAEAIYRELGDDQSPAFAALLNNRGVYWLDTGFADEAVAPLEQALALAGRHFGNGDPRALGVQASLIVALLESGDIDAAEQQWLDLAGRVPDHRPELRHRALVTGAELAAGQGRAAAISDRLAAAGAPPGNEGRLSQSAATRMREISLSAVAHSLRGQIDEADRQFARAQSIGGDTSATTWPRQWRNHLAWAAHLTRHGREAEARAHRQAALALLSGSGVDGESKLARRLVDSLGADPDRAPADVAQASR